ncbi:MAG: lysylphosphatidylglycerol synthase transmembrane domain-containing protein [Candidatus Omnitrophota bacterium]|nr:flippase-like domain-containing protein [Candidatus Omnitrophota bacterium]MBU1928831.1 flippase-like domain-containing protein [Candidatus Omnitrophota bacterium]
MATKKFWEANLNRMKIIKKILTIIFRVGISILLLYFIFRQVDEKSLLEIVSRADVPLLLLAAGIFFLNYFLCFFRWEMILKTLEVNLPWKKLLVPFTGGIFFNLFLPSTIGGDFVRSVDLAVHTKKTKEVVASVFLDRLSGYIGLVVITLIALLCGWGVIRDKSVLSAIALITGILGLILLVLFNNFIFSNVNKMLDSPRAGRIRESLKDLHEEIYYFKGNKRVIVYNLLISIVIQAISPLTFYVISRALGLNVNILYFFIFLPVIGAITLLPISIGGLGVREMTIVFFFAKVGVSKDIAFAMSLLNSLFMVVFAGIGGLIYVLTIRRRRV